MKYEKITPAQIITALDARLSQLEQEHLSHEISKIGLAALPDSAEKTAALKQVSNAQATLDAAWTAVKADLAARPK